MENADSPVSVLFVCTGNICRSPLAEALLKDYASRKGQLARLKIGSAGTFALSGNPATREAQRAARRRGLDLSGHRAREVSRGILEDADFILGMTRAHCLQLEREFPQFANKIYLALSFPRRYSRDKPEDIDVPDPMGLPVDYYEQVLEMLEPALPRMLESLLEEESSEDSPGR
jgi:protein-tyrosine-phosphatase